MARAADEGDKLRVRRGLGTRDREEASKLVDQLNAILGDASYWTAAAREQAARRFHPKVVAAFYDHLEPMVTDPWRVRDGLIPLPLERGSKYRCVQLVGTTGAGKTTVVRQLIGTDPRRERFPSTSAARTTTFDLEIVLADGPYRGAVSFLSQDQVRQLIAECVIAAVACSIEGGSEREVARRLLEHSEQRFRLNYMLGNFETREERAPELSDGADPVEVADFGETDLSEEERIRNAQTLGAHLQEIRALAAAVSGQVQAMVSESSDEVGSLTGNELEEAIEGIILDDEHFHCLVDGILDDVAERFQQLSQGELDRARNGWPIAWSFETEDRAVFLAAVNRFSSNYAPNFGRLLTPLVEGIRVRGPFKPAWWDGEVPPLVILDGQGIGHVADLSSSISTAITRRFEMADMILLVDNAAQPMQAASCAALKSFVHSGHEAKVVVCFTHFEDVVGANLPSVSARIDHVLGSLRNAANAVGKVLDQDAERRLNRQFITQEERRAVFLSRVHRPLCEDNPLTAAEFHRLLRFSAQAKPAAAPRTHTPSYDVGMLAFAIQRATEEFHLRWGSILGFGGLIGVQPEHWARIKALSRRIGIVRREPDKYEYHNLRPVADLINLLQTQLSNFVDQPTGWDPPSPPEEEAKQAILEKFKKVIHDRLHTLATRRIAEDCIAAWAEAYRLRGKGSADNRRRDIRQLYQRAVPVPNREPEPEANRFLSEIRDLVGQSLLANGGNLKGWTGTEEERAMYARYVEDMRRNRIEPRSFEQWLVTYREQRRRRGL